METLLSILQILGNILLFPVRVLFYPFERLIYAFQHGTEDEETPDVESEFELRSKVGRLFVRVLKWIFALPLLLLRAPFVVGSRMFSENRRDLLYLLPAFSVICFLCFVFFRVGFGYTGIVDQYRKGAYQAMQRSDFKAAQMWFGRLETSGELQQADKLQLAMAFAGLGESAKASRYLDALAPDQGPVVYEPAHRIKALKLAQSLGQSKDPFHLRKLKHH